MAMTREQLRDAALELKPAERQTLAEELLLSLTAADADAVDAAWLAEAYHRDAKFAAGATGAKPVDAIIERLRNRQVS
jgi:hypothetical protein